MDQAETIIRPLVENLAGYQGALELIDANGNALSISFFDSEENAQAAEPTFDDEMPRKLGELYKDWEGSRVSAERPEKPPPPRPAGAEPIHQYPKAFAGLGVKKCALVDLPEIFVHLCEFLRERLGERARDTTGGERLKRRTA
jgi:hypothetical protein